MFAGALGSGARRQAGRCRVHVRRRRPCAAGRLRRRTLTRSAVARGSGRVLRRFGEAMNGTDIGSALGPKGRAVKALTRSRSLCTKERQLTSTDRSWRRVRRLWQLFGVAALVGVAFAANTRGVALAAPGPWEATWAASPMSPTPAMPNPANAGFTNQTVRNIVYTSIGGNEVRVRLSNVFGTGRLRVGSLWIGVELTGARLVPGTLHRLTFAGHRSITVPPGAEAVSDPVTMTVSPQEDLAISVYLPGATGQATYHSSAQQTTYIASGNHANDVGPSAYTTTATSWYFIDEVD